MLHGPGPRNPFSPCAWLNRMDTHNLNREARARSIGITYEREDSFVIEFAKKSTKCSRKEGNVIDTNRGLQEAFLAFKKRRQKDAVQHRLMKERALSERCDEARMLNLRRKFLDQAKQYFGVPYKRKYHEPGTAEYNSPIFLDCCGLVRRVLRDLKEDFGFTIGPWNQAYQFDTLPIVIREEKDMQPGDLVFISGIYNDPKRKKQKHNMVHVEIWAGDGSSTIGARWQKGKVQVHDSYRFEAKSYHSMVYHFRSIDTWLKGICKSFCSEHPWMRSTFQPSKRSVFSLENDSCQEDEDGNISQEDIEVTPREGVEPGETPKVRDERDSKGTVETRGNTELEMVEIDGRKADGDRNRQDLLFGAFSHGQRVRESKQFVSQPENQNLKEVGQHWQREVWTKDDGCSFFGKKEEYDEDYENRGGFGERNCNEEEEVINEGAHYSSAKGGAFSCDKTDFHEVESYEYIDIEVEEELLANLGAVDDESWLFDSGLVVDLSPGPPSVAWDIQEVETEKLVAAEHSSTELSLEDGWQISKIDHSCKDMKDVTGQTGSKRTCDFEDECMSILSLADCSPKECISDQTVVLCPPPVLEQSLGDGMTSMDELEEASLSDGELRNLAEDDDGLSFTSRGWSDDKLVPLEGHIMREELGNDRMDLRLVSPWGVFTPYHSSALNLLHRPEIASQHSSLTDSDSPKDIAGQSSSGDTIANHQSGRGSSTGQPANGKTGSNLKGNDNSGDGQEKRKSNSEGRKLVNKAESVPLFYIGGKNGVSLVEEPLLAKGWQRIEDNKSDKYKLRWVEIRSQINYSSFRPGEQLINRIPGSGMLATKTGLFNTLRDYERFNERMKRGKTDKGMKMQDFFPESYVLDNKADRETFFQTYNEGEIWICKPNNMNQGKGIYLVRNLEELKKKYSGEGTGGAVASSRVKRGTNQRLIQRYLPNPLLLNGKKFDVRTYMLIACTNPFVVFYHSGYCRLSCEDYDAESQDLARHLTNQYQQKKVAAYQEVKNETVWSMERFNDYINTEIAEANGLPSDWVFGHFTKRMHQIMTHCFHAVKNKLDTSLGLFDLLGFDFIIDTDMKIWLLEVNVNPALHTNCDVLKEKLPPMIAETLDITLEIFEKSQKKQKILPLKSLKNFHLLYSATIGGIRHVRPQRTKSTSPTRADKKAISPSRVKGSKSTVPPKSTSSSKEVAVVKGLTPKATSTVTEKDAAKGGGKVCSETNEKRK